MVAGDLSQKVSKIGIGTPFDTAIFRIAKDRLPALRAFAFDLVRLDLHFGTAERTFIYFGFRLPEALGAGTEHVVSHFLNHAPLPPLGPWWIHLATLL